MSSERLRLIKQTAGITPDDVVKYEKLGVVNRFLDEKQTNSGLTKRQLCAKAGISESQLDRSMKDLGMTSFYRYKVPVKKTIKKEVASKEKKRPNVHKGGRAHRDDPDNSFDVREVENFANKMKA